MPAPLSLDLRRRIVEAAKTRSQPTVAVQFSVARATVQRFVALARQGNVAAKPHGGGQARLLGDEHHALVAAWLAENPSLTQAEIAGRLRERGVAVSRQTTGRTLARMGYTRKKKS